MTILRDNQKSEIQISAVLDAYAYLDDQKTDFSSGTYTLSQIVEKFSTIGLNDEQKPYYEAIQAAIESNPEIGNYTLISQSAQDAEISPDLLYAVAFESPEGDIYVSYRGTGDGKWVDNGVGMYETSIMQKTAADYFDYVVRSQNLDESNKIIVTGHSKGGNSAQYATLGSQNARLVDACYSFDGQGFSKTTIAEFKEILGIDYDTQLEKMYSINGENDYVHDLGIAVIPESRTFFVDTQAEDFVEMHHLVNMIDPKNDIINYYGDGLINLDNCDEVTQKEIGKFAKKLSKEMMKLSDEDLCDCAITIMTVLEKMNRGDDILEEGTGDVPGATTEELIGFIANGLPNVLKSFASKEGIAMLGVIAMNMIEGIAESENGAAKLVALFSLVGLSSTAIASFGGVLGVLGLELWKCAEVVETLNDTVYTVMETVDNLKDAFSNASNIEDVWNTSVNLIVGKFNGNEYSIFGDETDNVLHAYNFPGTYYIYGEEGNDSLYGDDYVDNIDGGNGDDCIHGEGSNDFLFGGEGNDSILGGSGNDTIDGGDGDDLLFGGEDNDNILGGNGDDLIFGEDGEDLIIGNDGNDKLYGGNERDRLYGEEGNDILDGEAGDDILYGGKGSDTYKFNIGSGDDVIYDSESNYADVDTIMFGEGITPENIYITRNSLDAVFHVFYPKNNSDEINQEYQEDTLTVKDFFSDETISASVDHKVGIEQIEFCDGTVFDAIEICKKFEWHGIVGKTLINGSKHDDNILGTEDNENIFGGTGDDLIYSDDGNDIIYAGAGDDIIDGGEGDDILSGGDGIDTYIFGRGYGNDKIIDDGGVIVFGEGISPSDLSFSTAGNDELIIHIGSDTLTIPDFLNFDLCASDNYWNLNKYIFKFADGKVWNKKDMEIAIGELTDPQGRKYIYGNNNDNTLTGTANDDFINGGDGNDIIYGNDGDDYLRGGEGDNEVYGGNGNDIIYTQNGYDKIYGGNGDDYICSGNGGSYIDAGEGANKIIAGLGFNEIHSGSGKDHIDGGDEDDVIYSGDGDDYVNGNQGNNTIDAGNGNNEIYSGDGDDNITAYDGDDFIAANKGHNIINAGNGNNIIYTDYGNDEITTGDGEDQIYSSGGDDIISSGAGDDYICINNGNNTVDAGAGNNTVFTGDGDDNITAYDGDDYIVSNNGTDVIHAGHGKNVIYTGYGRSEIYTGDDDDKIYANAGLNKINAGEGNNIIYTGWERDEITTGGGNDEIYSGGGGGAIHAGNGDNIIYTGYGTDEVYTGDGDDEIFASSGFIDAGEGSNRIEACDGDVTICTGNGYDEIYAGSGNDYINSGDGVFKDLDGDGIADANWVDKQSEDGSLIRRLWNCGDLIQAGDGNNTVISGNGNDKISSGSGRDNISSGSGDDIIFCGTGDDVIDAGAGNDYISSMDGSDTYIFGKGYGNDVIADSSENNKIRFLAGIMPENLEFIKTGSSLKMQISDTEDSIVFNNYFGNTEYGNFTFEFSDGTVMKLETDGTEFNLYKVLYGTDKDEDIYGSVHNDFIDGGAGKDFLKGYDGDDVYIFGKGYGKDSIYDDIGLTKIRFKDGITIDDLKFLRNGLHLDIEIIGTEDKVSKMHYFYQDAFKNLVLEFEDGTSWSVSDNLGIDKPIYYYGSDGNDYYYGNDGIDIIDGGKGNDTLWGYAGDDVYIFGRGYGNDSINDNSGISIVKFKDGITLDELKFVKQGSKLCIQLIGTDDSINEMYYFSNESHQNLVLEFEDGTSWSVSDNLGIDKPLYYYGTDEADDIYGSIHNDIIDGGSGDDFLKGYDGDDVYIFGKGYGKDSIYDDIGLTKIRFKDGITIDDLKFIRGSHLDIEIMGTEDKVSKMHYFYQDAFKNLVLEFEDGTSWSVSDNLGIDKPIYYYGSDGNDYYYGNDGIDIIDGGKGNDTLWGYAGDDIYTFGDNHGADTVLDTGGNDIIKIDEDFQNLMFSRSNKNLLISEYGKEDSITVQSWYANENDHIETIISKDGSSLAHTQVEQLIQAMAGFTSENNISWSDAISQNPSDVNAVMQQFWVK